MNSEVIRDSYLLATKFGIPGVDLKVAAFETARNTDKITTIVFAIEVNFFPLSFDVISIEF